MDERRVTGDEDRVLRGGDADMKVGSLSELCRQVGEVRLKSLSTARAREF